MLAEYGPVGVAVQDACHDAGVKLIVHFHGYDASHQETLNRHKDHYLQFNINSETATILLALILKCR